MKLFGTFALGVIASTFLIVSPVAALEYLCEFKNPSPRKTIPEQVLVKVSADGKSAEIVDPFLLSLKQAPLQAKSFSDTSKLMKVSWLLSADLGGSWIKFDYLVVYRKARGKAFISLTARGYDNNESGTGSCEIRS